ncbi:MAG TPA: 4-hydroxy-tetrahydrodipicolinate reductase [Bacillota bacterium]|nr:4-hydroxy-tetrahydrodipicolinate reductase [Bacillota bacterium]
MTIKIIVAGPRGKMGSETIRMLQHEDTLQLVACIDRKNDGKTLKDVNGQPALNVPIYENPLECFQQHADADVLIDLTVPDAGYVHTKTALENHIRPVVGTSGFTNDQISALSKLSTETKTGCIIAPNFAVGAVLMMQFAKMAAKFFPDVEIIEKHHDQKLDAPSGSAIKTAQLIKGTRKKKQQGHPNEEETIKGSRGANVDDMRIHSVRLPGLIAHQEVIFGGAGQTLTIKHDSISRDSFMDGIKFAVQQVMKLDKLIYGLENVLDME